jgi:hypothetical protein
MDAAIACVGEVLVDFTIKKLFCTNETMDYHRYQRVHLSQTLGKERNTIKYSISSYGGEDAFGTGTRFVHRINGINTSYLNALRA